MTETKNYKINSPYLIFIGDVDNLTEAKTAAGIIEWRSDLVKGVLKFEGNPLDLNVPNMTIEKAIEQGVKTLVVGVAPRGGKFETKWLETINLAVLSGLDVVSGLHSKLTDYELLVRSSRDSGAKLIDVRVPSCDIGIAKANKRKGKRILTVGTDCAVGKKYTALALTDALVSKGVNATFRATGQTGIMIAGEGIPIDAVKSDFVSGAVELLSPDNLDNHWDVIEGQGSLFHPAYAGVSLGLLHGAQPDAIVLCHQACRQKIAGFDNFSVIDIKTCIEVNLLHARLTNPDVKCIGVSINTSHLPESIREEYLDSLSEVLELPCVDPNIDGCDKLIDSFCKMFNLDGE